MRAGMDEKTPLAATGSRFGGLDPLLAPRSVAVVGASDRAGNLGRVAVDLLLQERFHGPVWPVNPGRESVGGVPCYPSLRDLPGTPDLAILAVPADAVADLVRECGALSIPAAVVWAGGFAETGAEGRRRQEELAETCRRAGVMLCGPNCLGIMNISIGLMATFGSMFGEQERLVPGVISMVSQSGGISGVSAALAQQKGFGFRVVVSCGNEAVLDLSDFLAAIAHDAETRIIALYLEGLSDPEKFLRALAEAERNGKTVVVLKSGTTEASSRAALAHTGRLAGADRMFDAVFREFGAIRVHSVEEMLDVCFELANLAPGQLPRGRRLAAATFGGGSGVLAADICAREGLAVPPLSPETRRALAHLLTPLAATDNPVDLTPQSINDPKWRALLPEALKCIVDDPGVDSFLLMAGGMGHRQAEVVAILKELRAHTGKPVGVSWMAPPAGLVRDLASEGFHAFSEHARAVRALARVTAHADALRRPIRRVAGGIPEFAWRDFIGPDRTGVVSEPVVAAVLAAAGLPVSDSRLARTPAEAATAATELGFPLAVKGISAAVTHRAAAGFLALDADSAEAVLASDREFRARAAERGLDYDGTFLQRMVPGGVELIVSAMRDPHFGVMVGCGIGGNMAEIIDDVRFARAPLDVAGALNLLGTLKTVQRHAGLLSDEQRRHAAAFIAEFSVLAASAPWRAFELEINPLKVGQDGAVAVDGLLVIGDPADA